MLNPDTSAKLAALPGVRAAAVANAEELQSIYRENDPARRTIATGLRDGSAVAHEVVDAHLTLLCDLTRPAARDWWARWLAERRKQRIGVTAPKWEWAIVNGRSVWTLDGEVVSAREDGEDALDALAAACLAVGGSQ